MSVHVYLSLGSNLNQPQEQIKTAFAELNQLPFTRLLKQSGLWTSQPIGPQDQPDFVNAAALIATQLEPLALLDELQALERLHQRVKTRHWGERTLDIDIICYDQQFLRSPRLNLPHPEAKNRAFVLLPLMQLNPELHLPKQGTIADLAKQVADQEIYPI